MHAAFFALFFSPFRTPFHSSPTQHMTVRMAHVANESYSRTIDVTTGPGTRVNSTECRRDHIFTSRLRSANLRYDTRRADGFGSRKHVSIHSARCLCERFWLKTRIVYSLFVVEHRVFAAENIPENRYPRGK
jgi:hypothetical protein|uniref:Uncharacterized protein n=1 Tax=Sipha flava TaxID=143950 RepID=A0A2S2QMP8_9HEMI